MTEKAFVEALQNLGTMCPSSVEAIKLHPTTLVRDTPLYATASRLERMGYNLDDLDRDNPYWTQESLND